jgi:L,D-transpeptidase ErfK/SrfK
MENPIMWAEIRGQLVVLVGLASAFTTMGTDTRHPGPISSQVTGRTFAYEVAVGDSLASVGARHGIDPREIALANGLKANRGIAPGLTLQLDNRHVVPVVDDEVVLVINVPQRMLFFKGNGTALAFPVALGRRDWPTPLGDFTVIAKEENPTWDVPSSIQEEMRREGRPVVQRVPPGPSNPLGAVWLGLSLESIGVHGTNAPLSIFRHVTHGCVRMHPDDIAFLYPLVTVGARGRVVYEPLLLAQTADGIFLEAHVDVYRRNSKDALVSIRQSAIAAGIGGEIDWAAAAEVLQARRGVARPVNFSPGNTH